MKRAAVPDNVGGGASETEITSDFTNDTDNESNDEYNDDDSQTDNNNQDAETYNRNKRICKKYDFTTPQIEDVLISVIYKNYDVASLNHNSTAYNKPKSSKNSHINNNSATISDLYCLGLFEFKYRNNGKTILDDKTQAISANINLYRQVITRYKRIKIRTQTFKFGFDDENNERLFEIETTDERRFLDLIELTQSKCVLFVFNSIDDEAKSLFVDVCLTSKVLSPKWLVDNPSDFMKANKTNLMIKAITNYFLDKNELTVANQETDDNLVSMDYNSENSNDKDDGNDDEDDDNENKSQLLFDLIYHKHKREFEKQKQINYDEYFQSYPYLLSILRPYQMNAIIWMLKREQFRLQNNNHNEQQDLHPLYTKYVNKHGKPIYYQQSLGIFCDKLPVCDNSLAGGILADDMGLGKTLEVLGCILLNPREDVPKYQIDVTEFKSKNSNFSCICGDVPRTFNENNQLAFQCRSCGVWTHVKCVNYSGLKENFLCPRCLTKQKPHSSGCTLIITPSVISHQWFDEIKKHITNRNLKVLLYKGCSYHGFIQPQDLAALDICITTYDVLSNELHHVWSMDNLPNLRHNKRFMNVPSPLICVEWWRICLDEAQMVHSTNAKCAEMANRLFAVNRWCVTGTPIGRSLSDLHGLFTFIREDPYYEKRWFNELLFEPYRTGNKKPLVNALSKVLWRTMKCYVIDQINIPQQVEKIHWLPFTPFETHLYERVLEQFREKREQQDVMAVFDTLDAHLKIDELDRETTNRLLSPLLELRLTCNHPQLILKRKTFMPQNTFKKDKILTMEKSLEMLIKKTKNECEQKYRTLVLNMNGMAGLDLIMKNYDEAIKTYKDILQSESEYDGFIKLDLLQKIHTLHNLNETLLLYKNEPSEELTKQLTESEDKYMLNFDNAKKSAEVKMVEKVDVIEENIEENGDLFKAWWVQLLNAIEESKRSQEFLEKLSLEISLNVISNAAGNLQANYTICGKPFKSFAGLKQICIEEYEKFLSCRDQLLKCLEVLQGDIDDDLVTQAAECHLRNDSKRLALNERCELCKCDYEFQKYAKNLFSRADEMLKLASKNENDSRGDDEQADDNMENEFRQKESEEQLRLFKRSSSDLENFFKLLHHFCKSDEQLADEVKIGKKCLELYEAFKEEFKICRQFWMNTSHQINSYDEIAMVKIKMRLREEGEPVNQRLVYVIEHHEVQPQFIRLSNEKKQAEVELRRKFGQALYLKNLLKTYKLVEGEKNEEICPICQHSLGLEWYVLVCGHCFCKECIVSLVRSESDPQCNCINCAERKAHKQVRCPLCREMSKKGETYLVCANNSTSGNNNNNQCTSSAAGACKSDDSNKEDAANTIAGSSSNDEFQEFKLNGNSNSTKIEGVVKCLMKIIRDEPNAKCLVFSYFPTMLDLIQDSLKENYLSYRYLKDAHTAQKNLLEFKHNSTVNILLIPYSFGANGLNLIEATHVLLVEPGLNVSQELQAIGRVHRIGQTRTTFVHRFFVRNTVEETVYRLFLDNTNYNRNTINSNGKIKAISIADLQNLFINI